MHDFDLFLYIQKGELIIGVEHKYGLTTTTPTTCEYMEVLAGSKHYESVGKEGVVFLVAQRGNK